MRLFKNVWFWFVIIVVFVIVMNKGYETFFFRPCSAHQWRQSDGASYALNYYQHNLGFLPPQVHHRHAEDGRAVSEFPIVYYLAAQLYKVFGFHDYFIRWIHFAIFLLGLIYITKTARLFTKSIFLQLLPVVFTITSSYLFYYSANFLPDVAALSLAMIGFYYFYLFDRKQSLIYFLSAFFFFVLAALLKISDAILMVCAMAFLGYQFLFNGGYFVKQSAWKKSLILLIPVLSVAILYAWVQYDKYVAERYHFGGNLFGLLPIWEATRNDINYIYTRIRDLWMAAILAKYTWIMLLTFILPVVFFFRKLDTLLRFFILLTFAGVVLYFFCWYKTFDVHDYYMINMFCLPLLIFYAAIDIIQKKQWLANIRVAYPFYGMVSFIFFHSVYKCRAEQIYRYYGKDYNTFNTSYYRVEPYLRSIGIDKNDMVVSVPDPSPNITLYLMNNIGYTECYTGENYNVDNFVRDAGVKYLIVGDTSYLRNPLYAPYCKPEFKVGEFESIQIFRTDN